MIVEMGGKGRMVSSRRGDPAKARTLEMNDVSKIYFFAMKRSGQHGVINWLCRNICESTGKAVIHHNACVFKGGGVVLNRILHQHRLYRSGCDAPMVVGYHGGENGYDYDIEGLGYVVCNFEDQPVRRVGPGVHVVLVRDPLNLLASRIRGRLYEDFGPDHAPDIERLWFDHYNCKDDPSFVFIDFNKWFSDEGYRRSTIEGMGFSFSDRGLNEMPRPHSKSSFDDFRYSGEAQGMKVLERYLDCVDHPMFARGLTRWLNEISRWEFGVYWDKEGKRL